jgi:hypothetical protein
MARTASVALVAAVAAMGCDRRPQAVLVCHNANCAHATDPFRDATLAALDDSLALTYLDRPAFDGIELDTVWDAGSGRCRFAHDFEHATDATGAEAADRVAAYLAGAGAGDGVSWSGDRFFVKIELKDTVSATGAPHSSADLAAHYACALDMYGRIATAAVAGGHELEIGFESQADLVRGLVAHPGWPGKEPQAGVHVRLISNARYGGIRPDDLTALRGNLADGIDILSFHASRIPDGEQQSYLALDVTVMLWMLDAALETFYAMEAYQPAYVVTNEAILFRRWMEE